MKKKWKKSLIYVISFLICTKIYFSLYEFVVNNIVVLPLEAIALTDLFVLLFSMPIIVAGTILIAKLIKKGFRIFM